MSGGLLEELAGQMKVPFLSDLRMPYCRKVLIQLLGEKTAKDYSLNDWIDIIEYLSGKPEDSIKDEEEAKAYLLKCLNE